MLAWSWEVRALYYVGSDEGYSSSKSEIWEIYYMGMENTGVCLNHHA